MLVDLLEEDGGGQTNDLEADNVASEEVVNSGSARLDDAVVKDGGGEEVEVVADGADKGSDLGDDVGKVVGSTVGSAVVRSIESGLTP